MDGLNRLVPSVRPLKGTDRSDIEAALPREDLLWYGRPDMPFRMSIQRDIGTIKLVLGIAGAAVLLLLLTGTTDVVTLLIIGLFTPLFMLLIFIVYEVLVRRRRYAITSSHFIIVENFFRPKAYCYGVGSASRVWSEPGMPGDIFFTWRRVSPPRGKGFDVFVGFTELKDPDPVLQLMKRVWESSLQRDAEPFSRGHEEGFVIASGDMIGDLSPKDGETLEDALRRKLGS